MVYSYDVFDTVITRRCATPKGIFAIMQEKLCNDIKFQDLSDEIKNNFFLLRVQAEQYARANYLKAGTEEISIEDIYKALNQMGCLNEEQIYELIKCEENLEIDNVVPNPNMVEEIISHVENHDTVFFISDMYLSQDIIAKMIEKADKRLASVPLYVSSDLKKSKDKGTLYFLLREKYNILFSEWIHTGDNQKSDEIIPASFGIKTRLINNSILLPIEKEYIYKNEDDLSAQMLIGASKCARLIYDLDNVASKVGTSLAAIILGSYAKWLLNDALNKGFSCLYFIARDGFLVKEIADKIINACNLKMKTKYIYGSRKAWRIPSITGKEGELIELFNASSPDMYSNWNKIAKLLGISREELRKFIPKGYEINEEKLSRIETEILISYLDYDTDLAGYICEKNKESRKLVVEYLKQETDVNEGKIAFVEIGGTGYTQKCLERIYKEFYEGELYTYYYQIYGRNMYRDDRVFVYNPADMVCKDAIEPLCRAMHGQTLGYKKNYSSIVPIIECCEMEGFQKCGYEKYVDGLMKYFDIVRKYYPKYMEKNTNRKLVDSYWNYYINSIDEELLEFIGEIPFDSNGVEKNITYAPKIDDITISKILKDGIKRDDWYYNGEWAFQFSLRRMTKAQREEIINKNKDKVEKQKETYSRIAHIPESVLSNKHDIVIYGAGGLGKIFAKQIIDSKNKNLVLWADKNYLSLVKSGYNVEAIDKIASKKYDIILIAVLNKKVADEIIIELKLGGVDMGKVKWISPKEMINEGAKV